MPETPKRPDFLLSRSDISAAVKPSFSAIKVTTEGSSEPERVPIIKPPSGVSPIVVSITLPPSIAVIDEPLPMWQVIIFKSSIGLPIISAIFALT